MIHVSKINITYFNNINAFVSRAKRVIEYDWFPIYHISLIKYPFFKINIVTSYIIINRIKLYMLMQKLSCLGVINASVTFHGIYSFPRDSFIVNISIHFWATLDMTCSGSQGDLVSPMKSVSYHAVCAVISVSSDVKV